VLESDLLKHLQVHGRRYQKIDLRGCSKLTGTVLFRECEKRALSEGLIKSEAIFDCKKFSIYFILVDPFQGQKLLSMFAS
jgi:hypothetical protein